MTLTCMNIGGRGRYRTADRWCVNPGQPVQRVSRGAVGSSNAQVSGSLMSPVATECRTVSACLGTLLAQRGFLVRLRSRLRRGLAFSAPEPHTSTYPSKTQTADPHTARSRQAA